MTLQSRFQKVFVLNNSNNIISLLHARDSIISIITGMVKISSKEIEKNLIGKIELISNEMITNIHKYENGDRFAVGINNENNMLYIYFLIKGEGLELEKINKHIDYLKTRNLEESINLNGMGYYTCIQNSDYFTIDNFEGDPRFLKEIVFGFRIES